jgi:hypothetical protein
MEKANYTSGFNYKGNKVSFSLNVYLFVDGKDHITYCPALDLCAYGNDDDHARKAFGEVLEMTLKYMINKRTLLADLEEHGWKIKGNRKMVAPTLGEMIKNEELSDILNNKEYLTYKQEVLLPALA